MTRSKSASRATSAARSRQTRTSSRTCWPGDPPRNATIRTSSSAIRMRVMGRCLWRWVERDHQVERGPPSGDAVELGPTPWATAMASTMASPSPVPSLTLVSCRVPVRSDGRCAVAPRARSPFLRREPRRAYAPRPRHRARSRTRSGVADGIEARLTTAWASRSASAKMTAGRTGTTVQACSPSGRRRAASDSTNSASSSGSRRRNWLLGTRDEQQLGSLVQLVQDELDRLPAFDRVVVEQLHVAPMIVSGVRSSWPTSLRNSRCANAVSSRSSMEFNVAVSSAISSVPTTAMRASRSRPPIPRAVAIRARRCDRAAGGSHARTEASR